MSISYQSKNKALKDYMDLNFSHVDDFAVLAKDLIPAIKTEFLQELSKDIQGQPSKVSPWSISKYTWNNKRKPSIHHYDYKGLEDVIGDLKIIFDDKNVRVVGKINFYFKLYFFFGDNPSPHSWSAYTFSLGNRKIKITLSNSQELNKIYLKYLKGDFGITRSAKYEMPRKWDKEHCESKSCEDMGFSEKASCRPYVDCYGDKKASIANRVATIYLTSKRDDPKMKNTGHGGLDTWFSGHGGGKPDERATWGDWIAITPIKHTVKKKDGEDKEYEPGDIVGPCGISSQKEWASVTSNGKKPLKCMPREKAYGIPKEERAELAKNKRREEAKHRGQKPVNTPTFSEEAKEIKKKKANLNEILIPNPPSVEYRLSELPLISHQYNKRYNPSYLQKDLDSNAEGLFSLLLRNNGVGVDPSSIREVMREIAPAIHFHKDYFGLERPNELAEIYGFPFEFDYLESAQTPTYPSGHTAQAFYAAHVLSEKYEELREDFFHLANMVAQSRIDRGVHYPSDNEAGKLLAQNLFNRRKLTKRAEFYREVSPPDSLSSFTTGTPVGDSENPKGENSSSLPNGDSARNIGRPSPDSPNLKYRNLDKSEANGRKPANSLDLGYVHDSGSGSARVIPYDSGFENNGSALRKAGLIRPPQHLIDQVAEIGKGLLAQYWLRREKEDSSKGGLNAESVEGLEWILEDLDYLPLGVKRGEHDEGEVIFQVNNAQRAFSEMEDQLKSANLTYPDFYKLKAKVDQLDAQDIFNNPRGNRAHIGSISDMTSNVLRELKKWSTGGKQYIPTIMRDEYLDAEKKISTHSFKDGGRYFIGDDELGIIAIRVQESSHGAANYYWDGIHHIIFNVLKNMTELPLRYLQDRETIAGHELVHAMQQHYANKANIEEAGLPGQTRGKKFRWDMKQKQKELRVQYAREGMDSELISIHALDDIEFYSRLLDEVTEFKRRKVSADKLNGEIRKWVSGRPFWVSLKRYKRKNWAKALGIFVDAVTP